MAVEDRSARAAPPGEDAPLSLAELVELSGLGQALLQELLDAGLLQEAGFGGNACGFRPGSLLVARRARRLRADLELDDSGTVLALTLLRRIETLEARLRELECQLGHP